MRKISLIALLLAGAVILAACDLKINISPNLNQSSVKIDDQQANLNQSEIITDQAKPIIYEVVANNEGQALKIKEKATEQIYIEDPQALCGSSLMFFAQPKDLPVIIFKPFNPGSDKPILKLFSLDLLEKKCQALEVSAQLGDFGAFVLSPDHSKLAVALETNEAKELKIFDLLNDKAFTLLTLGEGETLNGGYGALSNNFEIKWLDDKMIQYTVYEDTVKNYADKMPEEIEKVKEVRVKAIE